MNAVERPGGVSARLKLTLSYAGFVMIAGALLLGAVWLFLLRYVPARLFIASPVRGAFPVRYNLLRIFAPRAAVVLVLLLAIGLGGGWILAGRMLAPLARITEATRIAATGSLSHRIRLAGRSDEFRELADAFDAMLARLEAHSAEQQRFAANASHELRTPLAISQALLDVARKDPDHDPVELVERLHGVNARAIELTEALLLLSRADRRSFVPQPVDLSLVAEEAVETLLPLAARRGVSISTRSDPAPTSGARGLLSQLAVNLVHNAVVHNRPAGGTVWVSTGTGPEGAFLMVENTGDVVPVALVAGLVEPFRRATGRVRADDNGVGLGLTIVKSIAEAHDATLELTPRAEGGLRVTACLAVMPPGSDPAALAAADTPSRPSGDNVDSHRTSTGP